MENKCENCIHYDLCVELMAHAKHQEKDFVKECLSEGNGCTDHFKDKSLCVELPCKVGDTVYISDFAEVMEVSISIVISTLSRIISWVWEMIYPKSLVFPSMVA